MSDGNLNSRRGLGKEESGHFMQDPHKPIQIVAGARPALSKFKASRSGDRRVLCS